jgi:hypothetical protein
MIKINFKNCCQTCVHIKAYITDDKIRSNDRILNIKTVVGCEHEEVCEKLLQEKE